MTKFEDQLLGQLMAEHGDQLRAMPRPAPAPVPAPVRRRVRRQVWLAAGATGTAAAVVAGVMTLGSTPRVMTLGSTPALAAYSVTHHDGTVSVSVDNSAGVAGANTALHRLRAGVVVVPVRPGCPSIDSLPKAKPDPSSGIWISTGLNANGHRSISVKGTIPAGDTLILAFSGSPDTGSLAAGGIITGPVPRCVSLPAPPDGSGGSPSAPPASGSSQAG